MPGIFFIVGPTAVGKSAMAAEVAEELGAEIINADAFQIYHGLNLLTGKPDAKTQQRAPHHLLGYVPLGDVMSAVKFRASALRTLAEIRLRGKDAIVVGGSGLYVKGLTDGFDDVPAPDRELRVQLNGLPLKELVGQLQKKDPDLAERVDLKNPRRVMRALEIASSGKSRSSIQQKASMSAAGIGCSHCSAAETAATRVEKPENRIGVLLIRDRDDLYDRINNRVNAMFHAGVEEEVRAFTEIGLTAARALGLRQLQQFIAGEISREECIAQIQQATRRYAKRQLTWFRHQSNFPQLNLTSFSHQEAVSAILQMAQRRLARG